MNPIIQVENLSKQYRLGQVGTGTIKDDVKRWWHRIRGKEDPFLTIGDSNDRSQKGNSEYVWALNNINFSVQPGEVLGIIGRNGAGKSTLLKLLSRVTEPSTGRIAMRGRVASLLEVGTGFHPDLTGRENIYLNGAILGMTKKEITRKFDEIVDFAGVERYIDTPVKRYSSGMHVRLGFAVAAHLEPEILIVDEVLAVGDAEFQKKCLGKMKSVSTNEGRTVLFVSHQLDAIRQLCERVILIKNGSISDDGKTMNVIGEYIKDEMQRKNIKHYDSYLEVAEIQQVNDILVLRAKYNCSTPINFPHLGFVISDEVGIPIFASNPTLQNIDIYQSKTYQQGIIHVTIKQPKLIDGTYFCSIWFGDGKRNFIEDKNALRFSVVGMTNNKQYDSRLIGNIVPDAIWNIQEAI